MAEKIFTNGLIFKEPRAKAPPYVKGSLSIKVDEFIVWLGDHKGEKEWINIEIKESKGGKIYCELDTWQPKRRDEEEAPEEEPAADYPPEDINPDDIPF